MVFIRPYQESDFEACAHICRATLPPSLSTTPITAKLAPYIWTHQYTLLSPATCHMLATALAAPTSSPSRERYPSYIASVLSTAVAPPPPLPPPSSSTQEQEEPFWIPDDTTLTPSGTAPLQAKKPNPAALIRLAYDPRKLLQLTDSSNSNAPKSLSSQGWRATMHIDLLPAYQRRGWGRRLIDAYVRSVRASGEDYGRGAWIGIAPDNAGVVQFYEKVGFRLVTPSTPSAVEGEGTGGGGEDGIHMVIDIAQA
ncbi:Acyl-CoA N-acyltransferase [Apiospora phragmitis]|uniref:Acyl-CoA N-acyltransferase n=1 Tax=Apiospora phragmitis TaxID=2905665 RepID=A0ABR1W977_9PEZI